jgi:hypothetical protein
LLLLLAMTGERIIDPAAQFNRAVAASYEEISWLIISSATSWRGTIAHVDDCS